MSRLLDGFYQRTFIDTYSKVAFAKLYDRKAPITAADVLNDRVLPFLKSMRLSYESATARLRCERLDSIPLGQGYWGPFETAGIRQKGKVSFAMPLTRWSFMLGALNSASSFS